jgi:hypothetical protein
MLHLDRLQGQHVLLIKASQIKTIFKFNDRLIKFKNRAAVEKLCEK